MYDDDMIYLIISPVSVSVGFFLYQNPQYIYDFGGKISGHVGLSVVVCVLYTGCLLLQLDDDGHGECVFFFHHGLNNER
jgi:hypothetical protein